MNNEDYNRLTNNKYANQEYKPDISIQSSHVMRALSEKFDIPCEDGMLVAGLAVVESKPL